VEQCQVRLLPSQFWGKKRQDNNSIFRGNKEIISIAGITIAIDNGKCGGSATECNRELKNPIREVYTFQEGKITHLFE
jgi:hypothetical protein